MASTQQQPTLSLALEHVNVTVQDIDRATRFLLVALPNWRVRGGGTMDWYGKPIRWQHVGDEHQYIALQGGGEGAAPGWQTHAVGAKHIGFVVPSVDAVVQRLAAAGFPIDHWGATTEVRRSAYVMEGEDLQFEFVQYTTEDLARREEYAA